MKTENLINLIQNLNSNEKRAFRKYNATYTSEKGNIYIRMFDLIDKKGIVEEKLLMQKLGYKGKRSAYSRTKNYLYNSIIQALSTRFPTREKAQLFIDLATIEYLMMKMEFREALTIARKRKQVAEKYSYHHIAMILNEYETFCLSGLNMPEEAIPVGKNFKNYLEQQEKTFYFSDIYFRLEMMRRSSTFIEVEEKKTPFRSYLENELSEPPEDSSFFIQLRYWHAKRHAHDAIQEIDASFQATKKMVELFEENPHQIEEYPYLYYVVGKINYLVSEYHLYKNDSLIDKINELKSINLSRYKEYDRVHNSIFQFTLMYSLIFYSNRGLFIKAVEEFDAGLNIVNQIKSSYSNANLLTTYIQAAIAYFGAKEYSGCLRMLRNIENERYKGTLKEYIPLLDCLELLVHYCLENISNIESISTKIKRSHKGQDPGQKIARIAANNILKLSQTNDIKNRLFKEASEKMSLARPMGRNMHGTLTDYITIWFDAKANNIDYATMVTDFWVKTKTNMHKDL